MLSVIMLNVTNNTFMLCVSMLNVTNNPLILFVTMPKVTNNPFKPCVIMLSDIMLSVVFLSVVKPVCQRQDTLAWPKICKQAKETRRCTYNAPL